MDRYIETKEKALRVARLPTVSQEDIIETIITALECSEEITEQRATKVLEKITLLMQCKDVCCNNHIYYRAVLETERTY